MIEETFLLKETSNGVTQQSTGYGMSVMTTAIFLVGEMAGSGVLALPAAMCDTDVIGFVLIAACAFASAYTGSILGKCWVIVQSQYKEYRDHPRYPYPAIAMVTYGKGARILVSCLINVTMFGGSVVFLLLAADNIQELTQDYNLNISFCTWLCVVAACLAPLSWLGTPKDFWPVAVTAAVSTAIACCLIIANSAVDAGTVPEPSYNTIEVKSFLTAIGTTFFAFGGHPAFPTFQADMKQPAKFGLACAVAYITLACMYEPVAICGYVVYGSAVDDNILDTLSGGAMKIVAEILVTVHLLGAYTIVINPVCQEGEELLGISRRFGIGRVLFRTLLAGLALFVGLSIPQFSNILSLIGGSTQTALSLILPPAFYLKLCSMEGDWDKVYVPLHQKVILIEMIVIGLFILVAATYSSLLAVISDDFTTPCYL